MTGRRVVGRRRTANPARWRRWWRLAIAAAMALAAALTLAGQLHAPALPSGLGAMPAAPAADASPGASGSSRATEQARPAPTGTSASDDRKQVIGSPTASPSANPSATPLPSDLQAAARASSTPRAPTLAPTALAASPTRTNTPSPQVILRRATPTRLPTTPARQAGAASPAPPTATGLVTRAITSPVTLAITATLAPAATPPPPTDLVQIVPPVPDRPDPALQALIERLLDDQPGDYGIAVKHLGTGQTAAVHPDAVHESASVFKLLVMLETFHQAAAGMLRFDEPLTMTEQLSETMKTYGLPEPSLSVGQSVPLTKALDEMITVSENTAAILLLDRVHGYRVNATLKAMGITRTQILDGTWMAAGDAARILESIGTGLAVDQTSSRQMLTLLLNQRVRDRLPHDLPPGTLVANKTGNWTGVRNDVGIVYAPHGPFVIAVLAEKLEDEQAGTAFIAHLARAVYDFFEQPSGTPHEGSSR